ncbi:MAG: GspE/PulE family protein [Planctomycetota bacterium]
MEFTRIRIGDALIAKGLITTKQLQMALDEQRRAHRPVGEILISLGFVRSDQIAQVMAEALGIPFLRAREIDPDPVILSALDMGFVRTTQAFPIDLVGGNLRVAMVDPTDPEKVSAVRQTFPYALELCMITDGDLAQLTRRFLSSQRGEVASLMSVRETATDVENFPVEQVTDAILIDAVNRGATDIHVQPEETITRVRFRIDGVLQNAESLPRFASEAIISRIKIMSRLDIAERRRPQDGRLRFDADGRRVEMRVSIMPNVYGENVVLRILDRTGGAPLLIQLGLDPGLLHRLQRIAASPHGLFLVTGPTGSGKTTTLYSLLGEVDSVTRNVATIEDPVEYPMPLVRQSQTDNAVGYGFHEGLRALLRQDPDVVLVGEIRDQETAGMAIKAAMTGHLVLSTLHTNSAIGAVSRLVNLGIPGYLLVDSLIGVLAQRLVRRVCENCAEAAVVTPELEAWLGGDIGAPRQGRGCDECSGTGLLGRTMICELFLPTEAMGELLRSGAEADKLENMARASGFYSMEDDGKDRVRKGYTTMAEVNRVSRSHRIEGDGS